MPYWAEKLEVLTSTSATVSKVETSELLLDGNEVTDPSASIALYGRLPFAATNCPGFEAGLPTACPVGVPEVPGSRMVKFCQSVPTFGNCAMDFASRVVACCPDSVSSNGTLELTTTS